MQTKNLFQTIVRLAEDTGIKSYTKESREWFLASLKMLRYRLTARTLVTTAIQGDEDPDFLQFPPGKMMSRSRNLFGSMYMFAYDPKHAKTLKYYDLFPLIILLGPAKGGFYGLNLHYIDPIRRAIFFDRLLPYLLSDDFDDINNRFYIKYHQLKQNKLLRVYKACIKHYLADHIDTRAVFIPPKHWESTLFLPSDNFQKASRDLVWRDTRKIWQQK